MILHDAASSEATRSGGWKSILALNVKHYSTRLNDKVSEVVGVGPACKFFNGIVTSSYASGEGHIWLKF